MPLAHESFDLGHHLTAVADCLNATQTPMWEGGHLLNKVRIERSAPKSRASVAKSLKINKRTLYYRLNGMKSEATSGERIRELNDKYNKGRFDGISGSRLVPSIQLALRPNGLTERALRKIMDLPEETLRSVLEAGLEEGYWTKQAKKYFATTRSFRTPSPSDPEARTSRLERTILIVRGSAAEHRWVLTADLAPAGVHLIHDRLFRELDAQTIERWGSRFASRDRLTTQRSNIDHGRTDGLAITTGYVPTDVAEGQYFAAALHHLTQYIHELSIEINRVTIGTDEAGRRMLLKKDIPATICDIRQCLEDAAKCGHRNERKRFAVTVSYARLAT